MNEKKAGLVPRLRFPEFREAGEWEEKLVEEFFTVGSSKRVLQKDWKNQGIPFYRTRELVSLSKDEPFGSEIFISEELFSELAQKYGVPTEGDFLVSGVGTLGISYQVQKGDKFYFKDGNVLWFSRKREISPIYFGCCFESDWVQKQIIGQTSKSTVGTYTIQNAKKTTFWYPPNISEQQKIAACLSSLDTLTAAQADKLDALKTHKQGLMQQLFPREGETVPRLRFPEFREAGEWDRKTLGEVASLYKGKSISKADITADGKQPCIRYGELYTIYDELIDRVVSRTSLPSKELFLSVQGDVIIPASGETKIDIATAACVTQDNVALGGDLNVIRSSLNGIFLSYLLNGALRFEIAKVAQGETVVHLYKKQLELLHLAVPRALIISPSKT